MIKYYIILAFLPFAVTAQVDTFQIVLKHDFENDALGEYFYNGEEDEDEDMYLDWCADYGCNSISLKGTTIEQCTDWDNSTKVMRCDFPEGDWGLYMNSGIQWLPILDDDYDELYIAYRIKLKAGFEPVLSGKFPGLYGYPEWGFGAPGIDDGFAAKIAWTNDCDGEESADMYYYDHAIQGQYGDAYCTGILLDTLDNIWHTLTLRIVMNDVGYSNGIAEVFLDSVCVMSESGFIWRENTSVGIDRLHISCMFGGGDDQFKAARDEWIKFDNFVVWYYDEDFDELPKGHEQNSLTDKIFIPHMGGGTGPPPESAFGGTAYEDYDETSDTSLVLDDISDEVGQVFTVGTVGLNEAFILDSIGVRVKTSGFEPELYEYNDPSCDSYVACYGDDDHMAGNQFTVGQVGDNEAFVMDSIEIVGCRSGYPGTTYIYVKALDGSGYPTGDTLARGSFDGDALGTTDHQDSIMVDVSSDEFQVSVSTQYCWFLVAPNGDGDNLIHLSRETDDTYAGGYALYNIGAGWGKDTGDDWDHYFKVYGHYGSASSIDSVSLYIYNEDSDCPTGSALDSARFNGDTSNTWVTIYAPALLNDTLSVSTTYVLYAVAHGLTEGEIEFAATTADGYAGGDNYIDLGGGCSTDEADMLFALYGHALEGMTSDTVDCAEVSDTMVYYVDVVDDYWTAANRKRESQTFTPTEDFIPSCVRFCGYRTGILDTIELYIYAVVDSTIVGDSLAYGVRNIGWITETEAESDTIDVEFSYYTALTTLDTFAIVWKCKNADENEWSDNIRLRSVSSGTYTGGYRLVTTDDGGTWSTDPDTDFLFVLYGEETAATATFREISISNASHVGMPSPKTIKYRGKIYE